MLKPASAHQISSYFMTLPQFHESYQRIESTNRALCNIFHFPILLSASNTIRQMEKGFSFVSH